MSKTITKRNGSIVPFDAAKIEAAIIKALTATNEDSSLAKSLTERVCMRLSPAPTIEECQDIVEEELMGSDLPRVARAYILYRERRAILRKKADSPAWREECKKATEYFPSVYNYIVYLRTYSKFIEGKGRRETWPETVERFMSFMKECMNDKLTKEEYSEVENAIIGMEVLPSMRLLQFAGEAVRRNGICSYNCSYVAPTNLEAFRDTLMILMSGAGVGFSVEKKYVSQLPIIKKQTGEVLPTHVIEDSREGWCEGLFLGLKTWYDGKDIAFDYSKVRPMGAILKTSGGRASGPDPLKNLLDFARELVLSKQEGRLSTINVHDLMCKIGVVVLCGGVRRCVPSNSRILTRFGSFKAIKNIKVGDHVMTNNGWKPVVNVFEQGEQEVIKIKHMNGFFECTPNHRMAVLTDAYGNFKWKEANELTEDDILGFPMFDKIGKYLSSGKISVNRLPKFSYIKPKNSTTCKDIIIPPLDREIAWLIGHFQGNGYVRLTSKSGELSDCVHGDKTEEAKFIANLLERFGINVRIQDPRKNDYCIKIRVKSKQLATYFHEHVKQPKTNMNIPQFIKNASIDIKAAYLQGLLDADGSIYDTFILVTTVYEEYAKEIQNLCYSMNIVSRILFRKVNTEGWQNRWEVKFPNRRDKEMFNLLTDGIGYKKITGFRSMNGCSWPIEMFQFEDNKAPSSISQKSGINCNGSIAYDTMLSFMDIPFVPIKVKEIVRENKTISTYDIEVEGDHCFVCEGVLTHNSSEISLSDLDDVDMRDAKKGTFWIKTPDRVMSNNSAVYNTRPTDEELEREWKTLVESGSGERGIMSRSHLHKQLPKRRLEVIGNRVYDMGGNPCNEIILMPQEFCNLSTIAVRPNDDEVSLSRKIRIAAIIGTYQSTLTNFPVISPEWKENCELERLLGVSMTGMRDCKYIDKHPEVLNKLKNVAVDTNVIYADRFSINRSTAVTACKPEGTTSEMLGTSSGLHARFAPYYIRRIRISSTDPLAKMLIDQGVPYHPENGQKKENANTWVFEFPQKSPEGSTMLSTLSALDQLNYWKEVKVRYTEHNPSVTIHVKNHEWDIVLQWLKDNWNVVGGLSFLPYSDHIYTLAPFEAISKEEYDNRVSSFPELDFAKLILYEKVDTTERKAQWACVGDKCSLE